MKTSARRVVGIAIALAVLPWSVAAQEQAPAEGQSASDILADIETFRLIHQMGLTQQQAQALLEAARPLQEMLAKRAAAETAPEVIALLLEFRAAALAGRPITPEMWAALAWAQMEAMGEHPRARTGIAPELEELTAADPMWTAAEQAAAQVAAGMSEEQLQAAGQVNMGGFASDLLAEAVDGADMETAEWNRWMEDILEDILLEYETPPAGLAAELRAFFAKVRNMGEEEARGQWDALATELGGLIMPPVGREQLQEVVTQRLAEELMFNKHFLPCLAEYAAAGEAEG